MSRAFCFAMKALLTTGLVTLVFVIFALTEGVGYQGSANLTSIRHIGSHISTLNFGLFNCSVKLDLSLNPVLYPISYSCGKGQLSGVFDIIYSPPPFDENRNLPTSSEAKEIILGNITWIEMLNNLPYLFFISLPIGLALTKTAQILNKKITASRKTTRPELDMGDAWTEY